jgi:transmembrane sensor
MDLTSKTRASVADDAARWYARVHAPDCTGQDRQSFEAWLRSSPDHWRAYADAERTVRRFDQLLENDPGLRELADRVCGESPRAPRKWAVAGALAASLVVGLMVVHLGASVDHLTEPEVFATTQDQQRDVVLADSSVVHLDIGSEIAVTMTEHSREITLTRGRALFQVAKDAERPFTVTAGGTLTTALGTQFQVHTQSDQVVVVLTEGSVSVAGMQDEPIGDAGWEIRLTPGQELSLKRAGAAPVRRTIDPNMATSWSRGRLVFRGTPLAEALEEVNRYATRKLRLADPSLASLPVGGSFIAGDSELALSAFEAALPLRSVAGGGGEILLFKRYEPEPH